MREKFAKFYLDKEKDIVVNLYKISEDELEYVLETPNHHTGNLISNLAKLSGLDTEKNENDMKIIRGTIPASINGDNEIVYILRFGGIKVANIYEDGIIELKGKIPAISKTLMSQTKNYKLPIEKTIVKSYILKKTKFRTDLHTHMNANLTPEILIAMGIARQIKYPLYYVKKLNLKITPQQEKKLLAQREKVEEKFGDSELKGKYLERRIDDNTYINFADLILNNLKDAESNMYKIKTSLEILKDGQAVFTNLEKVYLYRYIFTKGIESERKIDLSKVEEFPNERIKGYIKQILKDHSQKSKYKNNTLRQDMLLWVGREYQKQGVEYVEIADTDLVKLGEKTAEYLREIHEIMPKIESETGVKIRFLAAIRRIPLTIIKDQITSITYLRENLDVLKAVAKSPYIVGSDFVGEEINDIEELKPVIEELVKYVAEEDPYFTIRIHAGENDSLKENVSKAIKMIIDMTPKGKKIPNVRIGHGLYVPSLNSKKGKDMLADLKKSGAVLEFQVTSNVRLNNLNALEDHPLKKYLQAGIKCVQGTDGCGLYGTDTIDEQLALHNLMKITDKEFMKMREVEDQIIAERNTYFKEKMKSFNKFLRNRRIEDAILELEEKNIKDSIKNQKDMIASNVLDAEKELQCKIAKLPTDKMPIVVAGGSFNSKNRRTILTEEGKKILKDLVKKINPDKAYFVVGHRLEGYEKMLIDVAKELNKKIEVYAIVPKIISEKVKKKLLKEEINGVRISTETQEFGIYKSFNYEIFERRASIVIALDGNSPVSNLVQEANNGKGKSKIYVNEKIPALREKATSLGGYVIPFNMKQKIVDKIIYDNPEIL